MQKFRLFILLLIGLACICSCAVVDPPGGINPPPIHHSLFEGADLGVGASLHGTLPFPADNAWNMDISGSAIDANNASLITSIGGGVGLSAGFGSGTVNGAPIGIPYLIVDNGQSVLPIVFGVSAAQSDPGPYPIPLNAPIEGKKTNGDPFAGPRHVIVIDRYADRLYELGNASPQIAAWIADAGAVFQLGSNTVRPGASAGWISADAAGLPIFPGLVRYDEVAAGVIRHALRFTVTSSRQAYVPPANHWVMGSSSPNLPPMGMRVRLKASYSIPVTDSVATKVILQALKTYGMIVADIGTNWCISGAPDSRWDDATLASELGAVKGSNFEVVTMSGLVQ